MTDRDEMILMGVILDLASVGPVCISIDGGSCLMGWNPDGEGEVKIDIPLSLWSDYIVFNTGRRPGVDPDPLSQDTDIRALAYMHIMENLNSLDVNPKNHRQPDIIRLRIDPKSQESVWERVYD